MTKPAESVRLPNGMTPIAIEHMLVKCRDAVELAVCHLETGHLAVAIPKGWIWKGVTLYKLEEGETVRDYLDKCLNQTKALYMTILREHGLLGGDADD